MCLISFIIPLLLFLDCNITFKVSMGAVIVLDEAPAIEPQYNFVNKPTLNN